jgi:hypothetical protein
VVLHQAPLLGRARSRADSASTTTAFLHLVCLFLVSVPVLRYPLFCY